MDNTNPFQIIVALGNPGSKYELTKHNIGWLVLDRFFDLQNMTPAFKEKFKGKFTDLALSSEKKTFFLYPQTCMNLSGESVRPLIDFYKLSVSNLIVLHDELDLPIS